MIQDTEFGQNTKKQQEYDHKFEETTKRKLI